MGGVFRVAEHAEAPEPPEAKALGIRGRGSPEQENESEQERSQKDGDNARLAFHFVTIPLAPPAMSEARFTTMTGRAKPREVAR